MSGSTSTFGLTTPALSNQASTALNSAGTAGISGSGTSSTANALQSLSGNYTDFLQMLMTQLKNQDPTSPMDTNAFTTELVQFSSVEQQINTNSSLNSLIQLTQSGQLLQSSSLVGHSVALNSTTLPLQNSNGAAIFTAPVAEPVTVSVTNSGGTLIRQDVVNATQGSNVWSWNGQSANGITVPDGSYNITITSQSGTTVTPVPFTVTGTATGLTKNGTSLNLQVGSVTTDVSNVVSVLN
jgi:flagellar basal-body rod modification protein FlgD